MKIETWDTLSKLTLSPQATVKIQNENQLNIRLNDYYVNFVYGEYSSIRLFYVEGLEIEASAYKVWWNDTMRREAPSSIKSDNKLYFELLKDFILTLQELGFGDFNFVLREWFPDEAKFV